MRAPSIQIGLNLNKLNNGGDGGIGEALPHRYAITCGAPSPLRYVEPGSHPPARCASSLIWLRQMAETAGFEPAEPF